jgi:uncharacterized protein YdhG (YjbR/CyaY superfamily)
MKPRARTSARRPRTIPEYIKAAPPEGQPHLRRLYAILKAVAPKAQQTIKWNTPFFVEPRFLFAFSAHKAHISFAPMAKSLDKFREELKGHDTTRNFLKVPYDEPLPEALIRKIAKYCVQNVSDRQDEKFW